MLQRCRQIQVQSAQITELPYPWEWDSKNPQTGPPGYLLWFVFSGEVSFQTATNIYHLSTGHVLCFPNDRERFTANNAAPATVACIAYNDLAETPRLPHRAWRLPNYSFVQNLFERAAYRFQNHEVWEATAALSVILDELMSSDAVEPHKRGMTSTRAALSVLDGSTLQQQTLTKLKKLDWSATQQLQATPPRTSGSSHPLR